MASKIKHIYQPPGSFAVARDLHRIVISALTMDPGPRTFVPRPKTKTIIEKSWNHMRLDRKRGEMMRYTFAEEE